MSSANPAVLALVERELKKDPSAKSVALQEKAVKVDSSIGRLSGRQFHAQYALAVRRRLFGSGRGRAGTLGRQATPEADPAHALLMDGYEGQKRLLDDAIRQAFERALEADSVARINRLFTVMERHRKELDKA